MKTISMPFLRMNASACISNLRTLAGAMSGSGKQGHRRGETVILSFMTHEIMSIVEVLLV
jgi:hypothetical protein